jgi:NADH:ubiquinone oxidoreductase subunit
MGFIKKIFTWWEGATFGAGMHIRSTSREVGRDALGNVYYWSKKGDRRYVIYNGINDASRIRPNGMRGCTSRSTTCRTRRCRPRPSSWPSRGRT